MFRSSAILFPLCVIGAAHAAEIADAPIPEDNVVGILIFLALMVASGAYFVWKIMRNEKKNRNEQDK